MARSSPSPRLMRSFPPMLGSLVATSDGVPRKNPTRPESPRTTSFPPPESTVSPPGPAITTLSPVPASMPSSPPMAGSLEAARVMTPRSIVIEPLSPKRMSLPPPPRMRSAPAPPMARSLPSPRSIKSSPPIAGSLDVIATRAPAEKVKAPLSPRTRSRPGPAGDRIAASPADGQVISGSGDDRVGAAQRGADRDDGGERWAIEVDPAAVADQDVVALAA